MSHLFNNPDFQAGVAIREYQDGALTMIDLVGRLGFLTSCKGVDPRIVSILLSFTGLAAAPILAMMKYVH